ncbi:hypothetical protein D9756_000709 [Leucocoprinus leucothites]|uniref:Uncharacterized protein n=1 Tax=Leucocoprinus leucothites TaxID=201217 RepID=A0A8H5GEV6_9AGAR|nr:hypothetical protein D9756_000709 [Leucoagaricus leucothites]
MQDDGATDEGTRPHTQSPLSVPAPGSAYIFKSSLYSPTESEAQPPWLLKRPKLSTEQLSKHSDGAKDIRFGLIEERRWVIEITPWPTPPSIPPSPITVSLHNLEDSSLEQNKPTSGSVLNDRLLQADVDYFYPRENLTKHSILRLGKANPVPSYQTRGSNFTSLPKGGWTESTSKSTYGQDGKREIIMSRDRFHWSGHREKQNNVYDS